MALKMKTGGRQKGTPNRTTKEIKEAINLIVSNNIDRLQDDIDSLEPKERIKVICDLLNYTIPKLQSIQQNEVETEHHTTTIVFKDFEEVN
jgi:hypothetical protein